MRNICAHVTTAGMRQGFRIPVLHWYAVPRKVATLARTRSCGRASASCDMVSQRLPLFWSFAFSCALALPFPSCLHPLLPEPLTPACAKEPRPPTHSTAFEAISRTKSGLMRRIDGPVPGRNAEQELSRGHLMQRHVSRNSGSDPGTGDRRKWRVLFNGAYMLR